MFMNENYQPLSDGSDTALSVLRPAVEVGSRATSGDGIITAVKGSVHGEERVRMG